MSTEELQALIKSNEETSKKVDKARISSAKTEAFKQAYFKTRDMNDIGEIKAALDYLWMCQIDETNRLLAEV